MTLNDIKAKRVLRALGDRLPKPVVESVTVEYDVDEDGTYTNARVIDEGKKKHHTPKFVQHCVTAITQDPERLAKIKAGGEGGEEGSPFAVCNASYDKKTRSKAAAHSQGEHHTTTEYEAALKKLRVENRQNAPDRGRIVFEAASSDLKQSDRSRIVYRPRG